MWEWDTHCKNFQVITSSTQTTPSKYKVYGCTVVANLKQTFAWYSNSGFHPAGDRGKLSPQIPIPHKTLTSINFLQKNLWSNPEELKKFSKKHVPRSLAYFKRPLIYHTSTPYFCRKMKPCKSSKKRRCKKTYQLSRYKKIAYFESEGGTMFQFRVRKTHHLLLNPLPRDTNVAPIIVSNGQK